MNAFQIPQTSFNSPTASSSFTQRCRWCWSPWHRSSHRYKRAITRSSLNCQLVFQLPPPRIYLPWFVYNTHEEFFHKCVLPLDPSWFTRNQYGKQFRWYRNESLRVCLVWVVQCKRRPINLIRRVLQIRGEQNWILWNNEWTLVLCHLKRFISIHS